MTRMTTPAERTVKMRIIAADPSVMRGGQPLTAIVDVPAETLAAGPRGARVHVVDYDASSRTLYEPADVLAARWNTQLHVAPKSKVIHGDPAFHASNVYAIVMRTLARFESALGRRINWGFGSGGHQLKIAPHAFSDANAFYSRRDEALLFGHFPDGRRTIFTCLSHDVVVHETSHAILDGLRERYTAPSSPDQAAFHEGFADVVALLSVFSLEELVTHLMDVPVDARPGERSTQLLAKDATYEALRKSTLLSVGRELGKEMTPIGRSALRHSLFNVKPAKDALSSRDAAHERGEVLVAAVMDAFVRVWAERLAAYFVDTHARFMDRRRAAEEGARVADALLTMVIRALDYCPPVHVEFGTFLSALVTADAQVRPTDSFGFRRHLETAFNAFGIQHRSLGDAAEWLRFPSEKVKVDRVRFASMQHDVDEVFRFAWENRAQLKLHEDAFTRVISVRPCMRVSPDDGFHLRETVAEVLQQLTVPARELKRLGVKQPKGMPDDQPVELFGGMTLVFDDFGTLRFSIGDSVLGAKNSAVQQRQSERIESLWVRGHYRANSSAARRFSAVHRVRSLGAPSLVKETW
ncbi:MAG: hypothetical protein DI536_27800 [Archangium gephyra]|uniref:Peptidase M4 domain-containing protein n=1 Tax=Archangium gephyra TaxID=48 RepID=A0A2W5SVU1_9BACT|nr:MAG: hypothetical protein DI536_27800 [Archangium gephyra]